MKIETFNITYHLNDGLNNPENKVVYVNNVATTLLNPTRFGLCPLLVGLIIQNYQELQ